MNFIALFTDFCAESSTARTFFSTCFSITEYSSRTSDTNDSARVNIVTAFFDFMAFFHFTGGPYACLSHKLSKFTIAATPHCGAQTRIARERLRRARLARRRKLFWSRQNHGEVSLGQ